MAFKGCFANLKNEVTKQINKVIKSGSQEDGEPSKPKDFTQVEGLLNLFIGDGGSAAAVGKEGGTETDQNATGVSSINDFLGKIQGAGGILPGINLEGFQKLLPAVMKAAEFIGKSTGDDTPRTETNPDGSTIDEFVKTQVDGRKIHSGIGSKRVMELTSVQSRVGDRGSGTRTRGNLEAQDFLKLRAQYAGSGKMFEDDQFPAEDASCFYSKASQRQIYWKRPHQIVSNPNFYVEGASRFDVMQGELGDCWLLAAVANLTLSEPTFNQVVPQDNSFEKDYCGIFHFRFWQYGKWVDVVVDDRLPCDHKGELLYMHSEDKNEFWSALLEKAYAKLHGSYEALKGGTTCEALEDFSGGVTELYEIQSAPTNLFKIMTKANERSSFMGCSIEPDPRIFEAVTPQGLVRGHAYSITDAKMVDIQTPRVSGKIPLVRIRNPWGNETEWKGAWSDASSEWQYITDDTKEDLGLTFDADGEFWMSYKDFSKYFQRLEICNLGPDALEEEEPGKKKWETSVFEGSWIRGATAGGCRNYIETFAYNPQYIIDLSTGDEGDEDGKCTVIIALMQKNRRAQRKLGVECLTIGFCIYHLKNPESLPKPLPMKFFKYSASVARSPTFINLREVSCRFKLPIGTYCIVPSTFEPNEEGDFIIRVFSETKNNMKEHDTSIGMGEVDVRVKEAEPAQQDEAAKRVQEFFKTVAGEDMEVDWAELKEVLDLAMKREFDFPGFSKEVCRSMVSLMDVDRSGKLGLDEFTSLWKNVRTWQKVFKIYDADKSGYLSSFELRGALQSAGYNVNNKVLEALVLRYGDKSGQIWFDDFIMCAVKLKCMMEIFKERDIDGKLVAEFNLEDWLQKTLYS